MSNTTEFWDVCAKQTLEGFGTDLFIYCCQLGSVLLLFQSWICSYTSAAPIFSPLKLASVLQRFRSEHESSGLLLLLQLRGVGNMQVKIPSKSTLDWNLALFHQWLSAAKIVWLLLPNSERVLCSSTRKFLRESHEFQSCCFTHCTPPNFLRQSSYCYK